MVSLRLPERVRMAPDAPNPQIEAVDEDAEEGATIHLQGETQDAEWDNPNGKLIC